MRSRVLLAVLGVVLVLASVVPVAAQDQQGHYQGFGDATGFYNIVPPGQDGTLNGPEGAQAQAGLGLPQHVDDQLHLYGDLVYDDATPGFDVGRILEYFKDASFGVAQDDIAEVYSPGGRDDVVVIRDASFGVPHMFGETREGTLFANGYTAAEDRLFLMDILRHLGRADLAAWLGAAQGNRNEDANQLAVAPYIEADFTAQIEAIRDGRGEVGQRAYDDIVAYTAGVNQYIQEALLDPSKLPGEYPALQLVPEEWVIEDAVAIASLVGGIFGKSGGREVRNLCALHDLEAHYGDAATAREVFDDLTFPADGEAPTSSFDAFAYPDTAPFDPASVPDVDCESLQPLQAPDPGLDDVAGAIVDVVPTPPLPDGPEDLPLVDGDVPFLDSLTFNDAMSNAILIGAEASDSGVPIAVFGPQTGYFSPQLLVEKDIHGPGIHARGVSFAGTDLWIQLGRGVDYAWSATSSHVDNVDEFVLRLCEPGADDPLGEATTESMGYLHDASCEEIEAVQEVKLSKPGAAGQPDGPDDVYVNKYFERTADYGPVIARGTLRDGTPIAVAEKRWTYGNELGSAVGFLLLNDPSVIQGEFERWRENFSHNVDYVFNWFYVDDDEIGYSVSCACPVPAEGTDPYLPQWGDGGWDWQPTLPRDDLPWDLNPDEGLLVSWNNKEAPGFRSSDSSQSFGPIHRSDLLQRRAEDLLDEQGELGVGDVVDVMALAGTTDLRAQELMPLLLEVMGATAPDDLDPRTQQAWDLLRAWAADDLGHRRDHDRDGAYEHAEAVAIMDAWWGDTPEHDETRLLDAVFAAGHDIDLRRTIGISAHDGNLRGHVGSAFQDASYTHVHKDLRQLLGEVTVSPWSRSYCGQGDLGTCRDNLWQSLSATMAALEDEFGSGSVDDWDRTIADDAVVHRTLGLAAVDDIHWVNRPTFQQVVQLPTATPGPPLPPPPPAPLPADTPTTGGGAVLAGVAIAALALVPSRRRWATRRRGRRRDRGR
ncbi:MAG: penicillin acylase family protein [Actinobacteria bacterium]|nr:penicillin acylase family protein [Actinomycetota bacterium]